MIAQSERPTRMEFSRSESIVAMLMVPLSLIAFWQEQIAQFADEVGLRGGIVERIEIPAFGSICRPRHLRLGKETELFPVNKKRAAIYVSCGIRAQPNRNTGGGGNKPGDKTWDVLVQLPLKYNAYYKSRKLGATQHLDLYIAGHDFQDTDGTAQPAPPLPTARSTATRRPLAPQLKLATVLLFRIVR